MRLANEQRQLRERGRIRIGYSTPSQRTGQKVPHKLDTFRFTAPDAETVELVAGLYGGEPQPWPDGGRDKWQVVTDRSSVPVIFPSHLAFSQCYEQYRGGFPVLRCDGAVCSVPGNKKLRDQACACDPDDRDCQLTTHLSVIVPDLPGLGVWRLVTHGWYAGNELSAATYLIEQAMAVGARVPARLFLESRTVRRLIDGKPETRHFVVPVLDLDHSVAALGGAAAVSLSAAAPPLPGAPEGPEALPPGAGWRPVSQEALPPAPVPSVADQLADNDRPVKPRANAAPPVRSTGAAPRSAADAAAATPNCSLCGEPYGTASVVRNPEPGGSKYVHARCAAAYDEPASDGGDEGGKDLPSDVTPLEGGAGPDQPPGPDDGRTGGGAAGDGSATAAAEPAPGAAPASQPPPDEPRWPVRDGLSHNQHRKLMALTAEVFPAAEGQTGAEVDEMRRNAVLELAALCGQPGLVSRTQLDRSTGSAVLDLLEALKAGTVTWLASGLVDTETGEVITWPPSPTS